MLKFVLGPGFERRLEGRGIASYAGRGIVSVETVTNLVVG